MATFTLFDLTYRVARELGILKEGVATGGSTTTIVDTNERTEENDYWNGGTAWILKDAGGAGAAPEKEYARITDHVASSGTLTVATFSAAVGAGDRYAVANDWLPNNIIISQINSALLDLGAVPTTDTTTITIADNQTEYTLPAAAGRDLRQVFLQTVDDDADDNRWEEIRGWRLKQAAPGTADTLILDRQYPSGYDLMLVYMATHAQLSASTDAMNEHIPVERVVIPAALQCLYYLAQKTGWNKWDQFIRRFETRTEQIRQTRPVIVPRRASKLMIVTSDELDSGKGYEFTVNKVRL